MRKVVSNWSVAGWTRYDEDEPDRERGRLAVTRADGSGQVEQFDVLERPDEEWRASHRRQGAQITDHKRGVTYKATLGADGEIDHLQVTLSGPVTEQTVGRLRSIPLGRIRAEVRAQLVAERKAGPGALVFTPEGGVPDGEADGTHYHPPTTDELLAVLADKPDDNLSARQYLAAYYQRGVKTVDRWLARARREQEQEEQS